jgi:hypothetical protein
MRLMLDVFGVGYAMPDIPHVWVHTINNCTVEVVESPDLSKFSFIVADCDHPQIQQRFECLPWHVSAEIEQAITQVVKRRNDELRKLKRLVKQRYTDIGGEQ